MQTFLLQMFSRGSINIYHNWPVDTVADIHAPRGSSNDYTDDRMHLNASDNYAYIHWVIRHEAAHAYNGNWTELQADSVANACGADSKPYQ